MSTMLAREIGQLLDELNVGIFGSAENRNIYVGEMPQDVVTGLLILPAPSPPPEDYIDTEYQVLDFWAHSPHTDAAYTLMELVYANLHRRNGYQTQNWNIYFSRALGNILDVSRDEEGGKLFRLSIQFTCRNLNTVS